MDRPRPWRVAERALTTTLAGLLALLFVANLPFYAGASLDETTTWRMEHARLTVERHPPQREQSFWVAANSEGLRWSFELRRIDDTQWRITLPLWMPLLVAGLACAWSWRPLPRSHGVRGR